MLKNITYYLMENNTNTMCDSLTLFSTIEKLIPFASILSSNSSAKNSYFKLCEYLIDKLYTKGYNNIISLISKNQNNFDLIELFIKLIYTRTANSNKNNSEKKNFIAQCKYIYNAPIFHNYNKLLDDTEKIKRVELIESLLISLILDVSKQIEIDPHKKMKSSFKSLTSVSSIKSGESIFDQITPSIPLIRVLIMELYLKEDNNKKYAFISDYKDDINPLIKGVPGIVQINKETKEYIVSLVKFFDVKLNESDNIKCKNFSYCIFSDYLENIIYLYKEYKEDQKKYNIEEDIICTYKHIFQSNKICTNFYISFYKNLKNNIKIEVFLKYLIKFLFYNHPKPFIFSFFVRLYDINKDKFFELICGLTKELSVIFLLEEKASKKKQSFYLNVVNFLWFYHMMLIDKNIQDKTVIDLFLIFLRFIIDNSLIGLPFLFLSPFTNNKDNKSIYELVIEIITFIDIDPELSLFKQYLIDKEGVLLAYKIDIYNDNLYPSLFSKNGKYSHNAFFIRYYNFHLNSTPRSMLLVTLRSILNLIKDKNDITKDVLIKKLINLSLQFHFIIENKVKLLNSKNLLVIKRGSQQYQMDYAIIQQCLEDYKEKNIEVVNAIFEFFKYAKIKPNDNDKDNSTFTLFKSRALTYPLFHNTSQRKENMSISIKEEDDDSFDECGLEDKCLLKVNYTKEEKNDINFDITEEPIENYNEPLPSFYDITSPNLILCLKRDLFLKDLSVYFKDVYFDDKNFKLIKKLYQYKILTPIDDKYKIDFIYDEDKISFEYPTIIRNYSFAKSFYPKIFLKQDLSFYTNSNFPIRIPYFLIKDNKLPNIDTKPKFPHFVQYKDTHLFYEDKKDNDKYTLFSYNNKEREYEVEYIYNKGIFYGKLRVTDKFIIFASEKLSDDKMNDLSYVFRSEDSQRINDIQKVIYISNINIEEIIKRRFLYMYQAIEFYLLNGKSYFFNFFSIDHCKDFITFIKSSTIISNDVIIEDAIENFKKNKITLKWHQKEYDNFQYLLYLNKYASRSYNDLNQYPIIPWISLNTELNRDKNKVLSLKVLIRDFEFSISTQHEEGKKKVIKYYKSALDEGSKHPCHFSLHYSTLAYVLLYLFRLSPYTEGQILLQNGKFDSPNRQFCSFEEILDVLLSNFDNRELIPEIFIFPEYFYNLNKNYFGCKNQTKQLVHNLGIPKTFKSPMQYVFILRTIMNSKLVMEKIHIWIDNIFGKTQSDFYLERLNTFHKFSYEQKVNLLNKKQVYIGKNLTNEEICNKLRNKIMRILLFGQTPSQIFTDLHPSWKNKEKEEEFKYDEYNDVRQLIWRCNQRELKIEEGKVVHLAFTYKRDQIYLLIKNERLNDKFPYSYYIKILKTEEFEEIAFFPIESIKLLRENKITILNTKYALFDIVYGTYFIIGRYTDNTIKIYKPELKKEKNIKVYFIIKTKSFTSALLPIIPNKKNSIKNTSELYINSFLSGHRDGKLIQWCIEYKETKLLKIFPKRNILAHDNKMITAILYIERHQLIITCADDGFIHIRKLYDFELMQVIDSKSKLRVFVDCFFSRNDLLYMKAFDRKAKLFYLMGCTLNGIMFSRTKERLYYTVQVTEEGQVICLKDKRIAVELLDEVNLEKATPVKEKGSKGVNYSSVPIVCFIYEKEQKETCYCAYENSFLSRIHIDTEELKLTPIAKG